MNKGTATEHRSGRQAELMMSALKKIEMIFVKFIGI
jgi:hypothetical protein